MTSPLLAIVSEEKVFSIAKTTATRYIKGGTPAGGDSYMFNNQSLVNMLSQVLDEMKTQIEILDRVTTPEALRSMRESPDQKKVTH